MTDIELNEFDNDNMELANKLLSKKSNYQNVDWTTDHEQILVEWADKAMCYRWLHSKAHQSFSKANAWFTIPVIIMSTTTGTANFAQERLPEAYRGYFSMGVGAVNIFAGILTTIAQFLKISELNEAHRVASIAWDKFYRNTKVELAKSPSERTPVMQMVKHAKEEFDRLMETSPTISSNTIAAFKKTFEDPIKNKMVKVGGVKQEIKGVISKRQQAYMDLVKPEICDTIESTANIVYKPKHELGRDKTTLTAMALAKRAVELKRKQDKIENIINRFQSQKQRTPSNQEIFDELDGEIALEFVENYVKELLPQKSDNETKSETRPNANTFLPRNDENV